MSAGWIRKFRLVSLQVGQRVLFNEAFAVVQGLGFDRNGPIVRIDELLSGGRLRIGQEAGLMSSVLLRSALLVKEKLKPGMEVRLDANQRVALEVIGVGQAHRAFAGNGDRTAVGGDRRAGRGGAGDSRHHRAAVFASRTCSSVSSTPCPRAFCCTARPVAARRCWARPRPTICASKSATQTGVDHPEFFLHVKGPEILNMWVGESERQVRDLFVQCRERAAEGSLAFLVH